MFGAHGLDGKRVFIGGVSIVSISFHIEIREGRELLVASSSDCPSPDKPKDSPPAQKTYVVLPMEGHTSYEHNDGDMALTQLLTREETSAPCPRDFDFVYDGDGHGCLVMTDADGKTSDPCSCTKCYVTRQASCTYASGVV